MIIKDKTTYAVVLLVLVLFSILFVFLRYKAVDNRIGKPLIPVSDMEVKSYSLSGVVVSISEDQVVVKAPIVFVGADNISYIQEVEKIFLIDDSIVISEFGDPAKKLDFKDIKKESEVVLTTNDNIYTMDILKATQVFIKK